MIQNKKYKIKNIKRKGFTLIEALVLLFVFSVVTLSFYNVISLGTKYILVSKNKLGAVAIANERMEIIRNLNYNNVGTVGGVVNGNIPQEEEIVENGRNYKIRTLVKYEDDSFDGTLAAGTDVAYKDYKIAKVTVSWNNGGTDQGEVSIFSTFVSPSLEVASAGDGVLSINVFSDQDGGAPIDQADVHIVNPDVGLNTNIQTDNNGNIMLVGAKESIQNYQLTISKSGYETVSTFPPYPDTTYNPTDIHASVIGGAFNVANIAQNKLAEIDISAIDYMENSVANLKFDLKGGRKIGTEIVSPYNSVYNLNVSDQTNSSGEKKYELISPGQYTFTISPLEDVYELISVSPAFPFLLSPESTQNITVKVINKNTTSFKVSLADVGGTPIAGAEVKLVNATIPYDVKVATDESGTAFFPTKDNPILSAGTYDLSIKADGFQDISNQIIIESGIVNKLDPEPVMIKN